MSQKGQTLFKACMLNLGYYAVKEIHSPSKIRPLGNDFPADFLKYIERNKMSGCLFQAEYFQNT